MTTRNVRHSIRTFNEDGRCLAANVLRHSQDVPGVDGAIGEDHSRHSDVATSVHGVRPFHAGVQDVHGESKGWNNARR